MPRQSTPKRRGRPRKISNVISDESEEDYREESQEETDAELQETPSIGKRHAKKVKYNKDKTDDESEDSTLEVQVEDDRDTRPLTSRTKKPLHPTVSDEGEVVVEGEDDEEDGSGSEMDRSSNASARMPSRHRRRNSGGSNSSSSKSNVKGREQEQESDTRPSTEESAEYRGNEAYEDYMTKLEAFHRERKKAPFVRNVPIGQVTVNLYKLAQSVESHGGVFKLTADKSWRLVAQDFKMPSSYTNGSYLLKQLYIRQLYDFDVHRGKISDEQIAANVHLSGGPSPLSLSPRSASPANFAPTPRHALTRNQPNVSLESRRVPFHPLSASSSSSRSLSLGPSNSMAWMSPSASASSAAMAGATTTATSWQTPNGKLIRPLMIKSTPGITNVPHHPFTHLSHTAGSTPLSYALQQGQHGKHMDASSLPAPYSGVSSNAPASSKTYDPKFLEALKKINLNHFQGGPKSRIFKALECSLPNEIDWAFQHILEFSNVLEQAILHTQQPSTGSYYQHPSALNPIQHQLQLIAQLGRSFIVNGLLDRILIHANPFFQILHALLATNEEKPKGPSFSAYDAAIMQALNAISNSTIYGISFDHLRPNPSGQGDRNSLIKQAREKKQLLEIVLARMMSISVILHNFTFLSVEDIHLLLSLKAFKLYLSKGLALIRLFAAVTQPPAKFESESEPESEPKPKLPSTLLGSRQVYAELTRAFTPQWIDIGNLAFETVANVSTLMDLKSLSLDLYFPPYLCLAMHSKDRYYAMTALDTITRWLIADTNAELLFPKLTHSGLLDHLITLLVVPDNGLAQSVLEFLFQYFDIAVASQLPVAESLINVLLPILFDVLYDALEFPAKATLIKSTVSYNQNLFNATMTAQQKTIKWIAVAYQAGSPNDIITARDLFHQYAEFGKKENVTQLLTNQEFFHVLSQIYPKSIPPKTLWESSSSGPTDKATAATSPAVPDKSPLTDPVAADAEKQTSVPDPSPDPCSCACFWQDCTRKFSTLDELQAHLLDGHVQGVDTSCHWMSCTCKTVDTKHLASHVLTHIRTVSKELDQRKGMEPLRSLPQFFYLKPRSMAESGVKVNEKASYIVQILSQICRLTHITPVSQREFAEFSEVEASQCIILHAFLPFVEKICVYWTMEHAFVLKYMTSILSHLKLFHSRFSTTLFENAPLAKAKNGTLVLALNDLI